LTAKGESKRGAAAGDVRQVRKEGRTYKEAKDACGSLGVLDCNTRQFFSRMCKRRGVSREEEAQEGEQLRKALWSMPGQGRKAPVKPDSANHRGKWLGG
jgi:hypothetical protein